MGLTTEANMPFNPASKPTKMRIVEIDHDQTQLYIDLPCHFMAEQYWMKALAGCEATAFPIIPVRGYRPTLGHTHKHQALSLEWENSNDHSPSYCGRMNLLQASWTLLLAKYAGLDDIVFGVSASNTPVESGNILPLRAQVDWNLSVHDWMKRFDERNHEMNQISHWGGIKRIHATFPYPKDTTDVRSLVYADEDVGEVSSIQECKNRFQESQTDCLSSS